MATYVPNATQTTEPVESRTVESAALEFRTLKESVNTRIAALTADFDALEAVVTAEDAKDLRVPEAAVAPLPAIAARAGKVLAFDAGGDPTVLVVGESADSSLRTDLAASSGSSLVGYDGGTVQDVLDAVTGPNGAASVGYTPAGTGAAPTTVQVKLRDFVSVLDFYAYGVSGAKVDPSGNIDSTGGFQAALTYCHLTGQTLYVPAGIYKITSQLVKPSSFKHPNIVGDGYSNTTIKAFGFGAGTSMLLSTGGSGAFCGAVVSGIRFDSDNGNATAAEIDGQCGLTFRDCQFGKLKIGLLPHNKSSGNFTEFVVADNCDFTSECVEALVYQRTGGNDSFHGTGLRECTINEAAGATLPKIRIGGAGSTSNDIIVYNAPLSFQIWKNTTAKVLANNTSRYSTNFHGNVTLELFGAAAAAKWKFCNDSRNTYFLGTLSSLQDVTQRGTLVLCDTFETKSDGTVSALLKPYRIEALTMASGANTIAALPGSTTETYLIKLRFADSSSPARKAYLLVVNLDASGVHTVTNIAQLEDYYGGSMPYPTFSMSGQSLVATAAFAATVTCTGTVSKIGIGDAFAL